MNLRIALIIIGTAIAVVGASMLIGGMAYGIYRMLPSFSEWRVEEFMFVGLIATGVGGTIAAMAAIDEAKQRQRIIPAAKPSDKPSANTMPSING